MENKINIAKLLKDCPNGMELDSTVYNGVVTLQGVADRLDRCIYPIKIKVEYGNESFINTLTEYGQISPSPCNKCVIFPKGKTTWDGFQRPFKDGDVVINDRGNIFIYKGLLYNDKNRVDFYCGYLTNEHAFVIKESKDSHFGSIDSLRLATEKEKLFKAMKEYGYRWDAETKTLEKVIESKEETDGKTRPTKDQDYSTKRYAYQIYQIPDGYEFDYIENNAIILKSKHHVYPKDYEECCDVLDVDSNNLSHLCLYDTQLIEAFVKLKICRDAYWKIAGEQMGLEKSWEPDYDSGVNKYGIIYMNKVVQKSNPTTNWERHLNKVLDFPTEEMRDAFYENFKALIEKCKELL